MKKEIPQKKEISFPYDLLYWDTMIKQNSGSAKVISRIRWDFVSIVKPEIVLDYGSGPGWFRAFAPERVAVDTFDVSPWPQTGIRKTNYDLITFWDVLEHIPDLSVIRSLLVSAKAVAVSTPILPKRKDLKTWKHYKDGEHVRIFTKDSLKEFFRQFGFRLIKSGYPEVNCGIREDIFSGLFKKKTIVFTNGVFDLLHTGHLELLKKARSLGDRLVVGIDSDKSAENLGKKPPRPINTAESRKKVLEAIKWVDEVVVFDDLLKVLKEIRPNIMVKGSDYTEDRVIGKDLIKEWNGEVHIIPLVEGESTTRIIHKIRNL